MRLMAVSGTDFFQVYRKQLRAYTLRYTKKVILDRMHRGYSGINTLDRESSRQREGGERRAGIHFAGTSTSSGDVLTV